MKKFNNTDFNIKNVGESVELYGWVSRKRDLGGLVFIDLRDRSGIMQLAVRPENKNYELASSLKNEYVIKVVGKIVERESKPLKDLSNTYFTVEDVKHEISKGKTKVSKEAQEFLEAQEMNDRDNLYPLEDIMKKIFKDNYSLKYRNTSHHRVYLSVTVKGRLMQSNKYHLSQKIKPELYHMEIKESDDKTVINIYNENPSVELLNTINN